MSPTNTKKPRGPEVDKSQQTGSNLADWIAETKSKLAADTRARPWKQTFGDAVDCKDGVKEDLIRIRSEDEVQHNSVGAA